MFWLFDVHRTPPACYSFPMSPQVLTPTNSSAITRVLHKGGLFRPLPMMVKGTVVVSVQDPDENKAKNEASNARAYLISQRYACGNIAVTRTKSRDQFGAVAHTASAKFVVQGRTR